MDDVTTSVRTTMAAEPGVRAGAARAILDQAPSFGADTLLVSLLVITIGVPLFYMTGLSHAPTRVAAYVISALLVPAAGGVGVWWVRWSKPSGREASAVILESLAYSFPAAVAVFALCAVDLEVGLLGVGIMVFVAGVVTTISSAMFGLSGDSSTMMIVRVATIVLVPVTVLGLTEMLPFGLTAISMWCVPLPVVAAGSIGAMRGLQYHMIGRESAEMNAE